MLQNMIGKTGRPVQNLTAIGNDLDNLVVGNAYDNNLQGRYGLDTLTGNAGADRFIFSSPFSDRNVDTITDFGNGEDRLVFAPALVNLDGIGPGVLPEEAFHLGTAAADADDRFIFDGTTLWYDRDGTGTAHQQVAVAIMQDNPTLTAEDILIG